uniref:Calreticulin n=1 Tax=Cuerna arida TaxID=1464854 RepID=A0A1B6GF90_9HEMI
MKPIIITGLLLAAFVPFFTNAETYFTENFDKDDLQWTQSKAKSDYGEFKLVPGEGVKTSQDARFYAMGTKFDKVIDNRDKTIIIQYAVRHPQNIDCGGGYLKLFDEKFDPANFDGQTDYVLMFGPDICGSTKKVHIIFKYNGEEKAHRKSEVRCEDDTFTHVYTLKISPDNKYEVRIDNEKKAGGYLEDDFPFLPDKKIKDPKAKKPSDWVDDETIDDPEDSKPNDWDQPEYVKDKDDVKPSDWDDEIDGAWEAKEIKNPDFKGEWKPKKIPNPAFKGPWIHPMIDNPEYKPNDELYVFERKIMGIGLDLWQVKSGTIFSHFLITDDEDLANEQAAEIIKIRDEEMKEEKAKESERIPDNETTDEPEDESEDTDDEDEAADENTAQVPPPIVEDHDEL